MADLVSYGVDCGTAMTNRVKYMNQLELPQLNSLRDHYAKNLFKFKYIATLECSLIIFLIKLLD